VSTFQTFNISPRIFPGREITFGNEKKGSDFILLGRLAERGRERQVWFDITREHVVAILGKRGSGKSYTLGVIAEGIASDDGVISNIQEKRSIILLDTLNIFWPSYYLLSTNYSHIELKKQITYLKSWDLRPKSPPNVQVYIPSGFESLSTPSIAKGYQIGVSDLDASDWGFLLGVDLFRDVMGQLINISYAKVTIEGWTDKKEVKRPPKEEYSIDDLIDCINNDKELSSKKIGFDVRTRRAVVSKLASLKKYPVFSTTGTPLHEILKPGTLTVLLLANVPDDFRCVIASVLLRKILEERREASLLRKKDIIEGKADRRKYSPRTWILIDEAQNIVPAEATTISTPILVKIVREGRNFGISLALTTQQPSALDQRIMAQVDTLILHKLSIKKDIDYALSNSKTSHPSSIYLGGEALTLENLYRKLPLGYAVVSNNDTPRDFVVQIRPRISVHGGFEA